MQPSDSGIYLCEVHNFPDVSGKSQVTIIVNVLGKSTKWEAKRWLEMLLLTIFKWLSQTKNVLTDLVQSVKGV